MKKLKIALALEKKIANAEVAIFFLNFFRCFLLLRWSSSWLHPEKGLLQRAQNELSEVVFLMVRTKLKAISDDLDRSDELATLSENWTISA